MIGRRSVVGGLLASIAAVAHGQAYRVGRAPGLVSGLRLPSIAAVPSLVPNVWLDSDLGPDTDDRDTILLMMDAHNRGVINLVGLSSSTIDGSSGAGLRELAKFAGVTPAPFIGVNKDPNDRTASSFIQGVRTRFAADETTNDSTDAGYVAMRKGLAAVSGKLIFLSIGGADNFQDLLTSAADGISSLNGIDLVTAKCSRYISMLGDYDQATGSGSGAEYNVQLNIAAANYVSSNWPVSVPLDWIGTTWGDVIHVAPDGKNTGDDWRNPSAFVSTPGPNKSYDLGTFYEVTGQAVANNWTEAGGTNGWMKVDPSTGVLTWDPTTNRGHSWRRWKTGVDRSDTGPVAAKLTADLAALCPANPFTLPTPIVDLNFLTGSYAGATLAQLICNGAAGRTALNADGSTATFGANVLRITDQGIFLDGNGSDTITFAGALLAAFDKTLERTVLVITNKGDMSGNNSRLIGASSGYVLGGGQTEASSWSGAFSGNGNLPAVSLPSGASWSNRTKVAIEWNATQRRVFLGGTSTEIVGKGFNDLTGVYLGHNSGGGERWNGFVERIIIYDKAVPYLNGAGLTS
jgi:hypothetical protein